MLRSTGQRTRMPSFRPKPKLVKRVGFSPEKGLQGFKGMRSTMQGAFDPQYAEWLHNCYSADPYLGGEIVPRPGRQIYPGFPLTETGAATSPHVADSTEAMVCQMLEVFTRYPLPPATEGEHQLVSIRNGKFCATMDDDELFNTWREVVDAATLAAAGIVLNAVSIYYATMFRSKLIVVGSTFAFSWDGTYNGGIVKLTNAGTSFYGKPTVYAGKLFLLRGDRRNIVWSEEGDETTGYEAGGFANAWDFSQTSKEPLTQLIGTNTALYVIRRGGISAIYGGTNADFQSTSTVDAVSATEGSDCPEGAILVGDTIWFINNQGRPANFVVGSSTIKPIHINLERAFTPYVQDGLGYQRLATPNSEEGAFALPQAVGGQVVYCRALDLVFYAYRYLQSPSPSNSFDVLIGFHAQTQAIQTVWSFPTPISRVVEHHDDYYASGQFGLAMVDPYGYCYSVIPSSKAGWEQDSWFSDRDLNALATDENPVSAATSGGRFDVIASVIGPRHYMAADVELRVIRLDIEYLGWHDGTIDVRWATPATMAAGGVDFTDSTDPADPRQLRNFESVPIEGLASKTWPTSPPPPGEFHPLVPPVPGHAVVGMDEVCRWIAFAFSWGHQDTRARLLGWQVEAVPEGRQPGAY